MLAKSKCQLGTCVAESFMQRYEGFPELYGLDDSAQLDDVFISSDMRFVEFHEEYERYRRFKAPTSDTRLDVPIVSNSKGRRERVFRCSILRLPS